MKRLVLGIVSAATVLAFVSQRSGATEMVRVVPAAAIDVPATPGKAVAVLAGGCFWGLEGVFDHVAGVTKVVSGYAGGASATAHYEVVGTGMTGHAESVEITYDPKTISFGTLLRIYFSVATDPTQLNHQHPDSGTQYRGTIFAQSPAQAKVASAYIAQLNREKAYSAPVVTTVETGKPFYTAEGYHQKFLARNPDYPYIVTFDLPKVAALKKLFPANYKG